MAETKQSLLLEGETPAPPLLPGKPIPAAGPRRPAPGTRGRQVALCACVWAAAGGRGAETRPPPGKAAGPGHGPRRRLCDFGFDLPGDELIPRYNRLRGDRKNGCSAICVAMGTIAGGARAWKNTAFVGSACHSPRGSAGRRAGSPFPQPRAGEALGPLAGRASEAGSDPKLLGRTPSLTQPFSVTSKSCHRSIVTSIAPTGTILSALPFLSQAPRGPQLVCSPASPPRQAQGQPPRHPGTAGQRESRGNRHPHADPSTHQGARWGGHRHLPLHSWQSQVCMDAHACKHACP